MPRELTSVTEEVLVQEPAWYVGDDGRLRMDKLMGAFQAYFREHSEHWLERFQYREAGPQLLLHAFVHRVVNGGGRGRAGVWSGPSADGPGGDLAGASGRCGHGGGG